MSKGRTVRLFLVDGSPTGILTAEIMNWTGHVLVAPRSRLAEALQRPEALRTGLYFLVGDDPQQSDRQRVYIGEADSMIDRLKSHAKDLNKDFWTHAFIVSSKDSNLTKAHARYLESRSVEIAKKVDRANVANGNEPAPKSLPESDVADMEFFLAQLQIVLPVVGLDALRPKPTQLAKPDPDVAPNSLPAEQLGLVLQSKKQGVVARAIESDGELTVLRHSQAVLKSDYVSNTYAHVRAAMIEKNILVTAENGTCLTFAMDVTFRSPSEAAAVVLNRNSNGRTEWRVEATGQTLKDWQDAKLVGLLDAGAVSINESVQ